MHPNLAVHNHPSCAGAIQALQDCHEANKFMRFLGACNQLKNELDACLTEEYLVERKKNFDAAMIKKKKYEELKAEIREARAAQEAKA